MKSDIRVLFVSFILTLISVYGSFGQIRPIEILRYDQNFMEWGFSTGCNFQQLSSVPFKPGYSKGLLTGIYVKRRNKMLSVDAALNLTTASYVTDLPLGHKYRLSHNLSADTESMGEFSVIYANLPVVAELRVVKWLALQMGASYTYRAFTHDDNGAYKTFGDVQKLFKHSNVSGLIGTEIALSPVIRVDLNFSVGFLDQNNKMYQGLSDKWYTTQATAGLKWRLHKWYPIANKLKKKQSH